MKILYESWLFPFPSCNVGLGNTGTVCVGFKTKTTLNWEWVGSDLHVVCLRRMIITHGVPTAAIQFASVSAKALSLILKCKGIIGNYHEI